MMVRAGIFVTLVFLGLFSAVYWTYAAGTPIGATESVSYYFGALAALCMSVAMLLEGARVPLASTPGLVLRPGESLFDFTPGQFAFVGVEAPGFREAHPFSISSGAGEGYLRFTVKALGDYTVRPRDHVHLLGSQRQSGRSIWPLLSPGWPRSSGVDCRGHRHHPVPLGDEIARPRARQDGSCLLLRARREGRGLLGRDDATRNSRRCLSTPHRNGNGCAALDRTARRGSGRRPRPVGLLHLWPTVTDERDFQRAASTRGACAAESR